MYHGFQSPKTFINRKKFSPLWCCFTVKTAYSKPQIASQSFRESQQGNAIQEEVGEGCCRNNLSDVKSKVVSRKMHGRAGESAKGESKVQISTSRSYLLSLCSPLPPNCPTGLNLCLCTDSLCVLSRALMVLPFFSASFCLFAPALHPQSAQQPVCGAGWHSASLNRAILKTAETFCSPPWHLGAAREL